MRLVAVLIFAATLSGAAYAQSNSITNAPLDPLYQCASITADQERLACFDRAVAALRTDTSEGRVVALDQDQVRTLRSSGLFHGESDEVVGEPTQVVRVYAGSGGMGTFELANGQVWRQIERGRYNNVQEGDTVTVERAAFGSYRLSPARGQAHRVRRVD